ncbi:MAG: hypothetical protein HOV76_04395 [Hamadaea sp.]|nr:hypothetical protein [Hamadaea sp.]
MEADDREFVAVQPDRRQAAAWSIGLTGVVTVLGAAFIVRGRDDVTGLVWWLQGWMALLLIVAFASLIRAVFLTAEAAAGKSSERGGAGLGAAKRWAVAGLSLIAMALLVAWLSPVAETTRPLMRVDFESGVACGPVTFERDGYVGVTTKYGSPADTKLWIPVDKIGLLREVSACP